MKQEKNKETKQKPRRQEKKRKKPKKQEKNRKMAKETGNKKRSMVKSEAYAEAVLGLDDHLHDVGP